MPKKKRKPRDEREEPLMLLTELISVTKYDGVFIIQGKAGEHTRIVAVTPGYARALSEAFRQCLDGDAGSNVVGIRAGH